MDWEEFVKSICEAMKILAGDFKETRMALEDFNTVLENETINKDNSNVG